MLRRSFLGSLLGGAVGWLGWSVPEVVARVKKPKPRPTVKASSIYDLHKDIFRVFRRAAGTRSFHTDINGKHSGTISFAGWGLPSDLVETWRDSIHKSLIESCVVQDPYRGVCYLVRPSYVYSSSMLDKSGLANDISFRWEATLEEV